MTTLTLTEQELAALIQAAKLEALAEIAPELEHIEYRRAQDRASKKLKWATDEEFREASKSATKALRQKRVATEPGYREKLNRQNEERRARHRQDPAKVAELKRKRRVRYEIERAERFGKSSKLQ